MKRLIAIAVFTLCSIVVLWNAPVTEVRDVFSGPGMFASPIDGRPCVRWSTAFRPLQLGDSAQIETGRSHGSDCSPTAFDSGYSWSTGDTAVVHVSRSGWIVGRAPGAFHATAAQDTTMLVQDGFVLPSGWGPVVRPESATIVVGDSVRFEVIAVDTVGRPLPSVVYSIYTAEFDRRFTDSSEGARPPLDKASHQAVQGPVVFVGTRPGTTTLRGEIGARNAYARLTIVARGVSAGVKRRAQSP